MSWLRHYQTQPEVFTATATANADSNLGLKSEAITSRGSATIVSDATIGFLPEVWR